MAFRRIGPCFVGIMPRLARTFTVVAVDLRGVGGSAATPGGYDAVSLAEDIRQLAAHLELGRSFVAGHDNGGMVAYALARAHPQSTRGVMILDVPIPGLAPWEQVKADPVLWHFGFHQTPNAPERLIAGPRGDVLPRSILQPPRPQSCRHLGRRPAPLRRIVRLARPAACWP